MICRREVGFRKRGFLVELYQLICNFCVSMLESFFSLMRCIRWMLWSELVVGLWYSISWRNHKIFIQICDFNRFLAISDHPDPVSRRTI